MNDVVPINTNLPAELQNLGNALIQEGATASGISDLLKFLAREGGVWVYGAEGAEVEPGSQWAVNPLSFEHGYVCWKDSKIAGEAMVAVGVAKPAKAGLEDHGSYEDRKGKVIQTSWDEQMSVALKCVSGEDKGVEVTYKTSTYGGLQAIKSVAKALGARINTGVSDVVALVEMTKDSYQHSEHGKTFTPQFDIVGWATMDVEPVAAEGPAAEQPDEPESATTDESESEKAPRRRRRRAG